MGIRNLLTVLLVIGILSSCETETAFDSQEQGEKVIADQPDSKNISQKWVLMKMTGSFQNSETIGDDMDWQESYLLKSDNTFVKARDTDGAVEEGQGLYSFITLSDGEYLELSYSSDNSLIGNCTGEQKEYLFLSSADTLTGTWNACDGPGLEYERVN